MADLHLHGNREVRSDIANGRENILDDNLAAIIRKESIGQGIGNIFANGLIAWVLLKDRDQLALWAVDGVLLGFPLGSVLGFTLGELLGILLGALLGEVVGASVGDGVEL